MDVPERMARASSALDVVRAVLELEGAAQRVRDHEDAAIVLAHADYIAAKTDRGSLLTRINAVREQMRRRL